MPLKQTDALLALYAVKIRDATISDDELRHLLSPGTFVKSIGFVDPDKPVDDDNFSQYHGLQDFVVELGKMLSDDDLHRMTGRLLALLPPDDAGLFMRNNSLAKTLLTYEMNRQPMIADEHFNRTPFTAIFPDSVSLNVFKKDYLYPGVLRFRTTDPHSMVPGSSSEHAAAASSSDTPPESGSKVALLDIDHTLLFDKREINRSLLNVLKRNGIKDVYLFTDMWLGSNILKDRQALIETLEKEFGLRVHGVITPSDIAWPYLNDKIAKQIIDGLASLGVATYWGPKFMKAMATLRQEIPELGNALTQGVADSVCGAAFEDLKHRSGDLVKRGDAAKIILSVMEAEQKLPHIKGLMFRMYEQHKPKQVSEVVIAEDNQEALQAVRNETCSVAKHIIQVTDSDKSEANYTRQLALSIIKASLAQQPELQKSAWSFWGHRDSKPGRIRKLEKILERSKPEDAPGIINAYLAKRPLHDDFDTRLALLLAPSTSPTPGPSV